jgi:multisubunit Na+/H+ antiporter MnhC subunit
MRTRLILTTVIMIFADLALVVVLAFADTDKATSVDDLSHLEFGIPLKWVLQAQHLDPPMPYSATMLSPLENPSSILWLGLVANLIVVGLALAIVGLSARMVLRKRHRTTTASGSPPDPLEGSPE